MYDYNNERTIIWFFRNFLAQKNHWEENYFLNFLVSRNVIRKGDFYQFLASKIYHKIWHCFNIFCSFSVSENFGMSPVKGTPEETLWTDASLCKNTSDLICCIMGYMCNKCTSFDNNYALMPCHAVICSGLSELGALGFSQLFLCCFRIYLAILIRG